MFGRSRDLALLQRDVVPVPPEVKIWCAFKYLPFSSKLCLSFRTSGVCWWCYLFNYFLIVQILSCVLNVGLSSLTDVRVMFTHA